MSTFNSAAVEELNAEAESDLSEVAQCIEEIGSGCEGVIVQDLVQIAFYIACVDQHVDRCFLPDRPAHEIVMSVGITQYQNLHFLSIVLLYDTSTCNGYEAGSIRIFIFRPLSFYTQWGRPPLIETGAFPTEMITKSGCSLSAAMGRRDESIIFIPDKT